MTRQHKVRTLSALAGVVVACSIASAQQVGGARSIQPAQAAEGPQGFSVVLVLGDLQTAPSSDNVPPAAKRALDDMKDFLPYKSYSLLDVAWMLSTNVASTRLKGPDDQPYELLIESSPIGQNKIAVSFTLFAAGPLGILTQSLTHTLADVKVRDQAARDRTTALMQLERERAAAQERRDTNAQQLQEMSRRLDELRKAEAAQATSARRKMTRGGTIIDTAFNMVIGETVVVGTSRVAGGEKALIALLTAVPQKR